ncbi:SAV_915 family protein [Amycolatopsis jejuensis]|uniref:SAV_915 family protein n=1 Tax=Amycolatopsis jejuensis TaxID=330084 RepID=UPI0012E007A9|nr:SAV_915 family protein [Amycolatopsis jejuensis]
MSVYVVPVTNPNLPPALYLPTGATGPTTDGGTGANVELRRTPDGRTALVAFTALDRLVDCCGENQPWILINTEHLPRIHQARPYDVIVLDSEIPTELRHPATHG